jgi:hypothetical protein
MKPWMAPASGSLLVAESSLKPPGPDPPSVTTTDTEMGTIFLLTGQSLFGVAEQFMVGGVLSGLRLTHVSLK